MVASKATSVSAYLDELPVGRRAAMRTVRDIVRKNLPSGYRETMAYGMLTWEVPLERYPQTYNGRPLVRAALAMQKQYNALYLMCAYQDARAEALLREGARREGKKLDMGRSCLRFRAPDELPLGAIAELMRRLSVDAFIAGHEQARARAKPAAKKVPAKKVVAAGKRATGRSVTTEAALKPRAAKRARTR